MRMPRRWLLQSMRSVVRHRGDSGDVPGWVLVTLMTAGLVVVLWAVAGNQLTQVFSDAITNVTGPGG